MDSISADSADVPANEKLAMMWLADGRPLTKSRQTPEEKLRFLKGQVLPAADFGRIPYEVLHRVSKEVEESAEEGP